MLNLFKNIIMKVKNKIINAPILVSTIICFIIFQLVPYIGLSQSYKILVQKGNEFYNAKSYLEAQRYYSEALKKKDSDLEVVVKLGESLWRCNKIYEANKIFNSIVNARNLPPSFYLYYGQSLRSAGNYREAKNQFVNYSQINQTLGDHFINSCDWALRNGNKSDEFNVSIAGFNSKEADFSPVYVNGKIIFSSLRNSKIQNFQIDNLSSQPISLPQPIYFQGINQPLAHFSLSKDQSFIAFSQINAKKNVRLIPESGFSSKLKWGNYTFDNVNYAVNEIGISLNQGLSQFGYPFFSKDGNSLYFSSNMEGGFGGMDLYVIYREGSNWTDPINLGPKVNSQGDEISPFLQGKTLYFSSNWHPGFGGYDIFNVSIKENNDWSDITNLGLPLNSPFDEFDFMSIGNNGYFTSNRTGGLGAEDIYNYKKKSAGLILKIVNALDGMPVSDVKIAWGACQSADKPAILTNILGVYNLNENLNTPCALTFSKEGFSTKTFSITSSILEAEELTVPIIRLGEIYLGQVFDVQSKRPIADVNVSVENLLNNQKMYSQSSSNGVFEFALKPNATYKLSFLKEGFTSFSKIVKTTLDGRDRTILGESFLTKGNGNVSESELKDNLNKGLSIQIVALTNTPPSNQFSDLWSIADIYVKREDNQVKIRMGVFKTQQEVLQALERVKQNGYPQAFIVEETNGPGFTNLVPVEMVEVEKPKVIIKPPPQTVLPNPQIETPKVKTDEPNLTFDSSVKYKIQLVALRDTRFFDAKMINHLGIIKEYKKPNNITAKVIGDYSENNVKQVLNEIRLAGFKDAYIVREINGELIPVPGMK
jgi:tetratricopeptide (TPR) repeat protein/predicted CopG family antitoxin